MLRDTTERAVSDYRPAPSSDSDRPGYRRRRCACGPTRPDPIDAHKARDVLNSPHAEVVEGERAISNLVVRVARYVTDIRQISLYMLQMLTGLRLRRV
jgi:hypothetical protein